MNRSTSSSGLRTVAVNGDVAAQSGMAAHLVPGQPERWVGAPSSTPMARCCWCRSRARCASPPNWAGWRPRLARSRCCRAAWLFKVEVDGPSRGYVCENYGAAFRLPELGPIGSNGLASARDFLAPVAAFETQEGAYEIVKKYGGQLWRARQAHSPFNVVAWHGNLTPFKYDTRHFMTIGSISVDHPDPSIFTVLTSPSDTPGWANCDFVIFPPRWLVAEDTFRPPWYHRNVMSEFMGLVYGQYDAKPGGFKPGGMSLHNSMVPHGPDTEAFTRASGAALEPHKLDQTLAFMFESRWCLRPTAFALQGGALDADYASCWAGLQDQFEG